MTRADFNDVVRKASRKLYGHAFRIMNNQEEAEDAVQEVFIKLWNMGERLGSYNSIDALAITMTKNYCIDQLRKKKNFSIVEDSSLINFAGENLSPLEQMEIGESNEIIHSIIDRLPENHKVLIKLKEIEGFSYEEIADKTDININTLRVTLSRARKFIRDEFNKFQYEQREIGQIN